MLHIRLSIFTGNANFSHVADVEHAAGMADGIVFVFNTCILNWHFKAAERHHLGAQFHMFVIKTSSFFTHGYIIQLVAFPTNESDFQKKGRVLMFQDDVLKRPPLMLPSA